MDIRYFLERRIAFIRQFYATASEPYVERKRKIKAHDEPFVPPYSEDAEPPFLDEWLEADESLHVLAYSCISMLSAALHLYLESWVKQSRIAVDESMKKSVFKKKGCFLVTTLISPSISILRSRPDRLISKCSMRLCLCATGLNIHIQLQIKRRSTLLLT